MPKKDLRKFDPGGVAEIELAMWRAYYRNRFLKLFFLLVKLVWESFSGSYFYAACVAYYAARAAADFRLHRGQKNEPRIVARLVKFFKLVSDNVLEPFDYRKAAELELHW